MGGYARADVGQGGEELMVCMESGAAEGLRHGKDGGMLYMIREM